MDDRRPPPWRPPPSALDRVRCAEARRRKRRRPVFPQLYQSRFGALPATVAAAIEATHDKGLLDRWIALVGTAPRDEVEATFGARRRPAAARRRTRRS